MKRKILMLGIVTLFFSFVLTNVPGATKIVSSYLHQKDVEGNYQIKKDRTITMINYPERKVEEWILISKDYELPVIVGNDIQVSTAGTVWYYSEEKNNYITDVSGVDESISVRGSDIYISEDTIAEISEGVSSENELSNIDKYTSVSVDYSDGQIVVSASNIPVKYETTYFNLKLTDGLDTTIIKMKVQIEAGDVETYAFQMNTNTSEGAVSEYNPSFRVINRSSRIVTKHNDTTNNKQVYTVKDYGTIYTIDSTVTEDEMIIDSPNDNVKIMPCDIGTLKNWMYATDNDSYYFAVTFKSVNYYLDLLDREHTIRAYAITEDGDYVLGRNVCRTSIYNIAQLLYDNILMGTQKSHDYLYHNVLNIVAIKNNYVSIGQSMLKALDVMNKSSMEYQLVNNLYKDLYHYAKLDYKYSYGKYSQRGLFTAKTETIYNDKIYSTEDVLLEKLNLASGSGYTTVSDWICGETEKYGFSGFYKKKNFNDGNTLVSESFE